jgi:hypothetical protein
MVRFEETTNTGRMLRDTRAISKVMYTMHALSTPCSCVANVVLVSSLNFALLVGIFETK